MQSRHGIVSYKWQWECLKVCSILLLFLGPLAFVDTYLLLSVCTFFISLHIKCVGTFPQKEHVRWHCWRQRTASFQKESELLRCQGRLSLPPSLKISTCCLLSPCCFDSVSSVRCLMPNGLRQATAFPLEPLFIKRSQGSTYYRH